MKRTIVLTSLMTILTACSEPAPYTDFGLPKVEVITVEQDPPTDSLYFPAVANAAERSHLSFRVAGEISRVYVKEGDKVERGALIAEIEPTDYQLDVDNASARYSVINSQYRRSKPLVNKGLLAKSQFDEIAAQRRIALAELELAKLRLSFTQLKAPVDGIISRVSVDQFENIQVGQNIVNIHSLNSVEILIQLPDRIYVNQPKQDDLARIDAIVKVPSGNEYHAAIKEFTTEPDPQTGTFNVTLSLPMPEDEYLLDGMAVEVTSNSEEVGLDLKKGVQVPIEAIFNQDGDDLGRENKFVWVVSSNGTVHKTQVVIGKATKRSIQILSGVKAGEQVVIAGISRLTEGAKVEVIDKEVGNE
ncbi:efflux RND transporter periplasmic adaptor subunit [Vibrio panuliri]|uniref:Efflux transporter periplasmic adaptor subunit n=1 Tax=Vibrio panuliri TaxID=1381081 RepID=A0ABX3FP95_9VIBR|nr:efflux RND transporter periplasmic adaptor subunit [Vibrio panuliri]KAB1454723.1 efflux RND transporter periplasmic adaptor subunit [Vibrio panuliri]OLQ96034.1 efflux transporter periplasmic adaptor subunit [Vibrio panuliri]